MIKNCIALLKHLIFLFRGRNDHGTVRSIDFEEYRHLSAGLILQSLRVNEGLILPVSVLLIDEDIAHSARKRKVYFFTIGELE